MDYQLCRADGMEWLGCGEHWIDANGEIANYRD